MKAVQINIRKVVVIVMALILASAAVPGVVAYAEDTVLPSTAGAEGPRLLTTEGVDVEEQNADLYISDGPELPEGPEWSTEGLWINQAIYNDLTVSPQNPENGTIVFVVATMPDNARSRSAQAFVSYGPAYEPLKSVLLNGVNGFLGAVEIEPGRYFCSYTVTNDPAMDYPISARAHMYTIEVTPGSCTVVYLDISPISFFEQITGQNRHGDAELAEQYKDADTEGFDTTQKGQIGCYLTVPDTFGGNVRVFAQNVFTNDIVELHLYASNDYTAYDANVPQGRYAVTDIEVLEEGENRFEVSYEPETATTNETEGFHITIRDAWHPDAELVTPSRDNNAIVQEAERHNAGNPEPTEEPEPTPEVTPEPVQQQEVQHSNVGFVIAVILVIAIVGAMAVLGYLWWKNQNEE